MKKYTALLLIVAFLLSFGCASAELDPKLLDSYNDAAHACAAPLLDVNDAEALPKDETIYKFSFPSYYIMLELAPVGSAIRTVGIYAEDDSCAADFLTSCMAWVSCLGKIDTPSYGMILAQFAAVRAGYNSTPGMIGMDAFQMVPDENGKYFFAYLNNDLSSGD